MQCSGEAYVRLKESLEIGTRIGTGTGHMTVLGGDATLKSLVTFASILDWVWQPKIKGVDRISGAEAIIICLACYQ